MVNRVKIEIASTKYTITTGEEPAYVKGLAAELDKQVHTLVSASERTTLNDALVLCAMNYLDSYRKSEENADHMRDRLTEYVREESKLQLELDEAKREIERLGRRLEMLGQTQLG